MKCDATQLSCGNHARSTCGKTGPLFPPLHVNDAGKERLKAPPRNKMALFEQFTVPCNYYVGSQSASRTHGTRGFHNTCGQYAMASGLTPALPVDSGTGGFGKFSYGSSISLSTCSAVVDADESGQTQMLEQEGDTWSLLDSERWTVERQDSSQFKMEDSKKELEDVSFCKVEDFTSIVGDKDEVQDFAVNFVSKGFHKLESGSTIAGKLHPPRVPNGNEHPYQEILEKNEGIGSQATSSCFAPQIPDCKGIKKATLFSHALSEGHNQVKNIDRILAESFGTDLKKQEVVNQGEVPSIATTSPMFSCDARKFFPAPPLQAIIKPKDVIHAVGQQSFWKARKAILRQQEIFTNQVFELHKLIEVQRLLAKMPNPLMEDRLPSAKISPSGLYSAKENFKKQHGNTIKGDQETTVPRRCEVQAREPKPLQSLRTDQQEPASRERQTHQQVDGPELQQAKGCSPVSPLCHSLTKGWCGQAPYPSSSQGMSTWGYPIGPLNRPFLCPPGVGPFSPGSGIGGTYVVGSGPHVRSLPYTFCATMPEQGDPYFGLNNQWPNPIYHGSFFRPLSNDWWSMSHPSPGAPAFCSEKPGPANSVPSINTKSEASSQSVHPAAVPLPSKQQQVGMSNETSVIAAKLAGSAAAASLLLQQDVLSQKPVGSGNVDDSIPVHNSSGGNGFMHQVQGSYRNRTSVPSEEQVAYKEMALVTLNSREGAMDMEPFCEKNALTLFPLQPSNTAACAGNESSCGGLIKAIPRSALAASEAAALILRSIQRERQL